MQYLKQLIGKYYPWSSDIKEIDLKNYTKVNQSPIGYGTYGCVFLVQNQKDNQKYAAKVSKLTEDSSKTFARELNVLSKIQHPAILSFEGFSLVDFSGEPNPTIITKYASNGSLRDILKLEKLSRAPKEWDDTAKYRVLYGVAKGMNFLHKKNFIHRDLKPENILLDEYLYPLISDFGTSKCFVVDEMSQQTRECGTIAYMAPEVFNSTKYDQSVDVYSYGFIMFEAITGQSIIQKSMTQYQYQFKIMNDIRPEFPKGMDINEDVKKLIQRCWSGDPQERPTFEEIAEFLRNEDIITSMNADVDDFNFYADTIDEEMHSTTHVHELTETYISQSSSSSIRKVDISTSVDTYSRCKIDETKAISIYPASQLVFLDSACQNLVKFAECGDSNMMVAVADSLIKGIHGFPKNIELGVKYLKCAAEMNNFEAIELYASMLIKGNMIPPDLEKADQLVQKLLSENHPNAKMLWAQIELTKPNPDHQKIQECLKKAASDGNVEAMIAYAKFCISKKDEKEAMKYLKLASDSGSAEAKDLIEEMGNKAKERKAEEEKRIKEEDERRRKEEEERERKKREEEERRRREADEERRRREAEERRRREEEERREAEERRRREEEERRKREEEDRIRREEEERRRMYFPSCSPNSQSIVDSLKSIGVDSSFGYRNVIANRNGISGYSGTAQQNVHLLSLLKQGQLLRP